MTQCDLCSTQGLSAPPLGVPLGDTEPTCREHCSSGRRQPGSRCPWWPLLSARDSKQGAGVTMIMRNGLLARALTFRCREERQRNRGDLQQPPESETDVNELGSRVCLLPWVSSDPHDWAHTYTPSVSEELRFLREHSSITRMENSPATEKQTACSLSLGWVTWKTHLE